MAETEDLKQFLREITLRFERGLASISDDNRANLALQRAESRRYFEAVRRQSEEIYKNTEEIRAEDRAGREALFRILDKLDGGGPAPAGEAT